MKLYKGSRFNFFRHNSLAKIRLLNWAVNLKPGDVFAACSGFNYYVGSIKINRQPQFAFTDYPKFKQLKGWEVSEVDIVDSIGGYHNADGYGGCVSFPESRENVIQFVSEWVKNKKYRQEKDWWTSFDDTLENYIKDGRDFVDSNGVLVSELVDVYRNRYNKLAV